jgi:hypothetical protein
LSPSFLAYGSSVTLRLIESMTFLPIGPHIPHRSSERPEWRPILLALRSTESHCGAHTGTHYMYSTRCPKSRIMRAADRSQHFLGDQLHHKRKLLGCTESRATMHNTMCVSNESKAVIIILPPYLNTPSLNILTPTQFYAHIGYVSGMLLSNLAGATRKHEA